ncbi:PQQ-binding-like beta-propeller repeat protein [Halovivax sp.]|uniref:PQQ-binding-like beta-propeller repeat protein n=1 Tax=Halovivax sp. TaxID=1935978 RepID=UPI0025C5DD7E|nr:PQQ-binding-like beta-propeller repeat protein [Halovivax sp.]
MAKPERESAPALEAVVDLGELDPARSRHMWRRSGVLVRNGLVVVGTWNGEVAAFDVETEADGAGGADDVAIDGDAFARSERWRRSFDAHPVTLAEAGDAIVVGCRGGAGTVAALGPEGGGERWAYDGTADVGESTSDGVFYWPYVVAVADDPTGGCFAAVRRYERDGDDRRWHSAVLAFDADGAVRWRYETDASPIAIDRDAAGERLAVGYNRCFADHQHGLVVLDAATGEVAWDWDPGTEGDRRVGDVAFDRETDALAVTSHGDYCGYVFDPDGGTDARGTGRERWRVELATERELEGQTLYAYPNHAYAHDGRVAFVTGNTYARENRETETRHPDEHTGFGYDADGERRFTADTGGFVHELAADGSSLVLPSAQNFRVRDAETHAIRRLDLDTGCVDVAPTDGIVTAAATDGELVAAIEEPIVYHDDGRTLGSYALHVGSLDG